MSIEAITAIAHLSPLAQMESTAGAGVAAGGAGQVTPALQQRFAELMSRHEAGLQSSQPGAGLNAAAHVIESQQAQLDQTHSAMMDYLEKAPSMTMEQSFSASAALMMQQSLAHVKLSLTEGVTKASNKSLQSLLKNE